MKKFQSDPLPAAHIVFLVCAQCPSKGYPGETALAQKKSPRIFQRGGLGGLSVFRREHDGEDARRLLRIAWVLAAGEGPPKGIIEIGDFILHRRPPHPRSYMATCDVPRSGDNHHRRSPTTHRSTHACIERIDRSFGTMASVSPSLVSDVDDRHRRNGRRNRTTPRAKQGRQGLKESY